MPAAVLLAAVALAPRLAVAVPQIVAEGDDLTLTADGGELIIDALRGFKVRSNGQDVVVMDRLSSMQSSIDTMQSSINSLTSQMNSMASSFPAADRLDSMDSRIESALSAAVDADHSGRIDLIERQVSDLVNGTTTGFASVGAQLAALESHYWNFTDDQSIFTNGDFEDDSGFATNVSELTIYRHNGEQLSIYRLEDDDRPPSQLTHGRELNYALRIRGALCGGGPCTVSYRLDTLRRDHPILCAGTYTFSAWARRSDDYNGKDMMFHNLFRFNNRGVQGWSTEPGVGVEIGAFPRSSEWQRVEVSVVLRQTAASMYLSLGYPGQHSQGWLDIAGVDVRRLGGDGSC